MEFEYDKMADALSIRFSRESIEESQEIAPGVIVDYGVNRDLVGIEILNFSLRDINLNRVIQMHPDELIPSLVKCA